MTEIKKGKYQHFKGGYYEVLDVVLHSETMEEMVLYKHLNEEKLWIRPKKMFLEDVVVDGKEVQRFKYIE